MIVFNATKKMLLTALMAFIVSFGFAAESPKKEEALSKNIKQSVFSVTTKVGKRISQRKEPLRDSFLHPQAASESWTFSGIVFDEVGARYGYSFLVLRQNDRFKVVSQVVSMSNGKEVFRYLAEKEMKTHDYQGVNLKIENAFLRYNEISDSWVFGVNQKQGFNFRVEANQKYDYQIEHVPGVSFYSLQGMRVNGQLSILDKSVFVVAKNAWLSHQWRDPLSSFYNINRVYCRFDEDKGLLLEQISHGTSRLFDGATLLEANGKQDSVSQFVQLEKNGESTWDIHVLSPKLDLSVESVVPMVVTGPYGKLNLYAGIIQKAPKVTGGFCILTQDSPLEEDKSSELKEKEK